MLQSIALRLSLLRTDKRGIAALEYALLAGLVALAIVTAVTGFGTALSGLFVKLNTAVTAL